VDLDVYNAGSETVAAEVELDAYGKSFEAAGAISKRKEFVLTPGGNRVTLVQTFEKP
ncbi:MAG: hypothetical protein GTN78_07655, partial [Gemmatimonadales bacterium]|nr:hypothetical protein [Gemmatimonadales bacterium]